MAKDSVAFLDRPAARLIAVVVIIFCVGLIAFIHRDDWRAGDPLGDLGDRADPAAPCIEQRFAEIDAMIDEGVADEAQATLFKQRAEAMCRAAISDGGPALPLPAE